MVWQESKSAKGKDLNPAVRRFLAKWERLRPGIKRAMLLGAVAAAGAGGFIGGRATAPKKPWLIPAGRFSIKLPADLYSRLTWYSETVGIHPNRLAQYMAEMEAIPNAKREAYREAILRKANEIVAKRNPDSLEAEQEALVQKTVSELYRDMENLAKVRHDNTHELFRSVREQVRKQLPELER